MKARCSSLLLSVCIIIALITYVGACTSVKKEQNYPSSTLCLELDFINFERYLCSESILRDKMKYTVRFGNCFLRVPLMYQPCCLVPCCQGKLGELTKNSLQNLLNGSFCILVE